MLSARTKIISSPRRLLNISERWIGYESRAIITHQPLRTNVYALINAKTITILLLLHNRLNPVSPDIREDDARPEEYSIQPRNPNNRLTIRKIGAPVSNEQPAFFILITIPV